MVPGINFTKLKGNHLHLSDRSGRQKAYIMLRQAWRSVFSPHAVISYSDNASLLVMPEKKEDASSLLQE